MMPSQDQVAGQYQAPALEEQGHFQGQFPGDPGQFPGQMLASQSTVPVYSYTHQLPPPAPSQYPPPLAPPPKPSPYPPADPASFFLLTSEITSANLFDCAALRIGKVVLGNTQTNGFLKHSEWLGECVSGRVCVSCLYLFSHVCV